MTTFHSLPATLEAMQYHVGDEAEAENFAGSSFRRPGPGWAPVAQLWVEANAAWLDLEDGEWIAEDSRGFYPIKPDVFEKRWGDAPLSPATANPWGDTVKAIESFLETEGVVSEGWILAVEQSPQAAWDTTPVRVLGSDLLTHGHAVGIADLALIRVQQAGAE